MHSEITRPGIYQTALALAAFLTVGMLLGCTALEEDDDSCVPEPNGIHFTSYQGVKSDATKFLLDSLFIVTDEINPTNDFRGPTASGSYFYPYRDSLDGFVTVELIKNDSTKALATFEATAQTGTECNIVATQRTYSVVWLESTGHGGYTDVEVAEEN